MATLRAPVVRSAGAPELPLLKVDAGPLRAAFAPTRGGRLLSLAIEGEELLWQNPELLDAGLNPRQPQSRWPQGNGGMGTWANVGGSKTWPAPQGWDGPDMWAGPPDPFLDSGAWSSDAWTSEISEHDLTIHVRMVSPDDRRSGLRITRTFVFTDGGLEFSETITLLNIADRAIRWSPWEVCQVRTSPGGLITFVGSSPIQIRELGLYEGSAATALGAEGVAYETGLGVSKHGCIGGTGAVRYRRSSGTTLTLSVSPIDGAEYPDGGCRTEVWLQRPTNLPIDALAGLHPDAHLAELEVLGPLVSLEPGESNSVTVNWSVTRDLD